MKATNFIILGAALGPKETGNKIWQGIRCYKIRGTNLTKGTISRNQQCLTY